jgi:hypothetical protein
MAKYITASTAINEIGVPGQVGFGVGPCDPASLLSGFTPMSGCYDKGSPNYGNYQYSEGSIMCWIPKFYYRFHRFVNITAATQANPCAITAVAHGFVTGDAVFICNVAGMTQLNNRFYTITRTGDDTFTLDGINSSAYGAYTSGGNVCKHESGVSAPGFNPTILTYGVNSVDIRGTDVFATTALANAEGYALHRAFVDGGVEQPGVMVDKYKWSWN